MQSGLMSTFVYNSHLKVTLKDKISVEHIYPQSDPEAWEPAFRDIPIEERKAYCNSLDNLLLLSSAINSSLQDDAFADKKPPTSTIMMVK